MTAQTADPGTLFDFITTEPFRASLESDYREMKSSLEHGNWKAVHVLAGSIIEAVLADCLIALKHKHTHGEEAVLKMYLPDLVSESKKLGILSDKTESLCKVVQNYRNLIHPGRVERLKETIDGNQAHVAHALVNMIANEVGLSKADVYGITAEQLFAKMYSDPAFPGLQDRLLKDVNDTEKERLLLVTYPNRILEFVQQDYLRETARDCFRKVFDSASDELKRKSVKVYIDLLHHGLGAARCNYELLCVEASDIEFAPQEERNTIKQHLISEYARDHYKLTTILKGIGRFLNADDVDAMKLRVLLASIVAAPESYEVIKHTTSFLAVEVRNMFAAVREEFHKQFNLLVNQYEEISSDNPVAKILRTIATRLFTKA